MENTEHNIKAKIEALMAKTTDNGCTEAEAMEAMQKAHHLATKYNIDMQEIGATGKEEVCEEHINAYRNPKWKGYIADGIAELYFCKALHSSSKDGGEAHYKFMGQKTNIDIAISVFKQITDIVDTLGAAYATTRPDLNKKTAKNEFCLGAADRIHSRCSELIKQCEKTGKTETSTGTMLVPVNLYKDKAKEIDLYFRLHYGNQKIGSMDEIQLKDNKAFETGLEAGNKVSLRQQTQSKASTSLLGKE